MIAEHNWDIDETQIAEQLGDGVWLDAWRFFGRSINHLVLQSVAATSQSTAETRESLRLQVVNLLPKSLEEALPFATRWVWNHKLDEPQSRLFVAKLRSVCHLGKANWTEPEMLAQIAQILDA